MNEYIKEYLLEHNKLQVNNFGVFELIYKSAQIHPILHTVTAPGRYVSFTQNIISDASEFAEFIASKKKITTEQANRDINQWVKDIKDTISMKKDYQLGSLGKFFSNAMGKIEFIPSLDTDISTESFGLEEFTIPVQSTPKAKQEKKVELPIELKIDNYYDDTIGDNQKKTKPKRVAFLIFLFLLLFLIVGTGITYLISPETVKPYIAKLHLIKDKEDDNAKEVEQATEDALIEDNIFEEQVTLPENKPESKPEIETKPVVNAKQGEYYVVIGSFFLEENAESFFKAKQKEYPNVLNLGKRPASSLILIGLGPYNTDQEAENQRLSGKSEWWIYKKK